MRESMGAGVVPKKVIVCQKLIEGQIQLLKGDFYLQ